MFETLVTLIAGFLIGVSVNGTLPARPSAQSRVIAPFDNDWRFLKGLIEVFHEADPTRPVTQALFRPNVSHDYDNGLADMLDVIGTNYRDLELLAAHKANPARKIVGTEQGHERPIWLAARDNPQHSGQFLWSGIDYLGESRQWPLMAANSGLLDRTGTPRPLAFERQSWWSDKPMVYITRRVAPTPVAVGDPGYEVLPTRRPQVLFSDWTPRKLEPHEEQIEIYFGQSRGHSYQAGCLQGTDLHSTRKAVLSARGRGPGKDGSQF